MTQQDLDRRVARATGENVREIRRRGFSVANPIDVAFDPEPPRASSPRLVDWDELASRRVTLFP